MKMNFQLLEIDALEIIFVFHCFMYSSLHLCRYELTEVVDLSTLRPADPEEPAYVSKSKMRYTRLVWLH